MKSLKLDHHLADLVRQGHKTSTWRLYDDKDISVNDTLQLIDKVDPNNPATWQPFATALVQTVIQKRLGDISSADSGEHGEFSSSKEILQAFKSYYGPQVTFDTPVKIIKFRLLPKIGQIAQNDDEYTTELKELKLYADGGSRGNPGPSASGYVVMDMDGRILVKKGVYLGVTTNNQAEYQALKLGLQEVQKMHVQKVHVFMDSLLVVNQMRGIFKVTNRDLWPINAAIQAIAGTFSEISYNHVPRTLNKLADGAVNDALDAAASVQS
ncbi:MAG TPA: reverse transcriptase-like protein [Nevskiaceae bacterium]|nr:reverse transcriptase-like protein [Nevskiaceae bacterium]